MRERKPPIPPGIVFREIGGTAELRRLEATAENADGDGKDQLIRAIRSKIQGKVERGDWRSRNAAYDALGLPQGRGKALMSDSPKEQQSVSYGLLLKCAYRLGIEVPHICPKRYLLQSIARRMRSERDRTEDAQSTLDEMDIERKK
jgi:hypothetical protein